MAKMNQDPEVIELLSKPDVQQAMMSIQQNPNDTMKFVSNPDVVKVRGAAGLGRLSLG